MNFLESIAIGNRPWTAAIGRDCENKTLSRWRWAIWENQSYRRRTTRKENEWYERNKGWRSESFDKRERAGGKKGESEGGRGLDNIRGKGKDG